MAASTPIYDPAPKWEPPLSDEIVLYHGCTRVDAENMRRGGIRLQRCRVDTDFGRGFYTTTILQQARQWAWLRFYDPDVTRTPANYPVVLDFTISRNDLAALDTIAFVPGASWNEGFWSFVQHCRQSVPAQVDDQGRVTTPEVVRDHLRAGGNPWYDLAIGPVTAFWQQKAAMVDSDQFSFHNQNAVDNLLTPQLQSGNNVTMVGSF